MSLGSPNKWTMEKYVKGSCQSQTYASMRKGATVCWMSRKFKEFAFKVFLDKDASELAFFPTEYNDAWQEGETI